MKITKRRVTKRNRIKRKYSKKRTKTRHSRKRVFSKKRRKTIKKKKRGGMSLYSLMPKGMKNKKLQELDEDKIKIFEYIDKLNYELKGYTRNDFKNKKYIETFKSLKFNTKFAKDISMKVINNYILKLKSQLEIIKSKQSGGGDLLLETAKQTVNPWGDYYKPERTEPDKTTQLTKKSNPNLLQKLNENRQLNDDIINNEKEKYDEIIEKMKSTITTEFDKEMKKYKYK
jgi:hypothetical protein